MRPPPLADVGTAAAVRHDYDSADVRRVHPDLPVGDAAARNRHVAACDARAYAAIRAHFPEFTPPRAMQRWLHAPPPHPAPVQESP